MSTNPSTPTGNDLRALAFDLNKLYAQKIGAVPTPTPMKALIDGNITVPDLERRLKLAGLEMYPDASGANFIRTIEAGNLHRELVRAERDVVRMEREDSRLYRNVEVGGSRFEPPEIVRERIPDPDEEHGDDVW